jgi:hypothetical protein
MTQIVRKEVRKRGFFGKVFKFLFIVFNIAMVAWLVTYWIDVGDMINNSTSGAERTGAAIGTTIGTSVILFFWAAGDLILGALTMFTRGDKIITEETFS